MIDIVERLRAKLVSSGPVMVCRHPVLNNDQIGVDHPDRRCVLDEGRREDCDYADVASVTTRDDCFFWQEMMRVHAEPPTIEEGLELCDTIEQLRARIAELEAIVQASEATVAIRERTDGR